MGKVERGEGIVEEQCPQEHTNPHAHPLGPNWVVPLRHFSSAHLTTLVRLFFGVKGMPAGLCLPSSRGVQPHDILYRLSLDILYTPARAKCAPELADGMEYSGYSRTADSGCSGGCPGCSSRPRRVF